MTILLAMGLLFADGRKSSGQEVPENPFQRQVDMPDLPADFEWLNTSGPIQLDDLRGKFVLLDFWTYCCINCIHVLPELKKLEKEFADELVVIGVHSAKFENERESKNIEEAILRYEIEHPVINDPQLKLWRMLGVQSWPTILLIDPEGKAVFMRGGEFTADQLGAILKQAILHYDAKGVIDRTPVRFDLLAHRQKPSVLRFPGKVLANKERQQLFISDSNHNRIVVTDVEGKFADVIGSGRIGSEDGSFEDAEFDHPQGTVLVGNTLYIADTENHTIRAADLKSRTVRTIAGTGVQSRNPWPGSEKGTNNTASRRRWRGKPAQTALNSPWALWAHKEHIYIAMAGPHQIWWMPKKANWIAPYAGNGREDIVDGPLLPSKPYELGASSFAQPSGLTSDGRWLYVADSEGSSIRAVPLNPRDEVRTVVGTANIDRGRLFQFGDVDGVADVVRLQHPLGVTHDDGKIYVTDTYNDKIKMVDATNGTTKTIAGTGQSGNADAPAQFDEPAGLSFLDGKLYVADTNNHAIRVVDLHNDNRVTTLQLSGIPGVTKPKSAEDDSPALATQMLPKQTIGNTTKELKFKFTIPLSEGEELNELAPIRCRVSSSVKNVFDQQQATKSFSTAVKDIEWTVPINSAESTNVTLRVEYVYCQKASTGLCRIQSVDYQFALSVDDSSSNDELVLDLTAGVTAQTLPQ